MESALQKKYSSKKATLGIAFRLWKCNDAGAKFDKPGDGERFIFKVYVTYSHKCTGKINSGAVVHKLKKRVHKLKKRVHKL